MNYLRITIFLSILFVFAAQVQAQDQLFKQEPLDPDKNAAIIGFDSMLLGAFVYSQWISDDDLQQKDQYHFHRIWGGEQCHVYSSKGFDGLGTMSAIHNEHPEFEEFGLDTRTYTVELEDGLTLGTGSSRLALRCSWNPIPRQAKALDPQNTAYNKILQEYLAQHGLPQAKPQIMQLFKVDLDGDGTDEVLICAQNIVDPKSRVATWQPDQPLILEGGLPTGAQKGNYSLVLLRKIVNGQVREIPLAQFIALKDGTAADPEQITPYVHKIFQFADLNGDGVLEVIMGTDYYEGSFYEVFEIHKDNAILVLENGLGV